LSKVSRWMRLAVVDTEDARFWRHGGVDWLAVARAAARDLERGRVVEGGSTITQQYVKTTYVSGERTLRRKLAGVVPALVEVPVARAAAWLSRAGLWPRQRLRVDDAAAPGTVLAQSPAGGATRPPGAPAELTVAVDASGAGGLGVTLVPEVLGQPEATARQLLAQAGLAAEALAGCDADPARAAAEPGRMWRSGPARGPSPPPPARSGCGSTRPTAHLPPQPQPADRCRRGPTGTPAARRDHGTGAPALRRAGRVCPTRMRRACHSCGTSECDVDTRSARRGGRGGSSLPPHGSGTTATQAATFFCRTVSSTEWACWSTKRVNSCWA
jgi:Transglycosylase